MESLVAIVTLQGSQTRGRIEGFTIEIYNCNYIWSLVKGTNYHLPEELKTVAKTVYKRKQSVLSVKLFAPFFVCFKN